LAHGFATTATKFGGILGEILHLQTEMIDARRAILFIGLLFSARQLIDGDMNGSIGYITNGAPHPWDCDLFEPENIAKKCARFVDIIDFHRQMNYTRHIFSPYVLTRFALKTQIVKFVDVVPK
jgi:hypothetical protein